jgi:parvulin-like peptidyl-prolyl isomerase
MAGCLFIPFLGWWLAFNGPVMQAQERPGPGSKGMPAASTDVVATVEGEPITRQQLAEELIARRGREQLDFLINRKIIEKACARAGLTVTDAEVDAEIQETMKTARAASPEDFEKLVLRARNLTFHSYREDTVRPGLMIRKLAGKRIQVTEEEIQRAFQSAYGEKAKCRMILCTNYRDASQVLGQIRNNADNFRRLAKTQEDPYLAQRAGEIEPIARYSNFDKVEEVAFKLREGEISHVIDVKEGSLILLREGTIPGDPSKKLADVRDQLHRSLLEEKLKVETPKLFKELKKQAAVQNHLGS